MKTDLIKAYYNQIFRKNAECYWEEAPGKNVVLKAIKFFHDKKIIRDNSILIDVGCSSGYLLNRIHSEINHEFELYGIDFSPVAIKKAKKNYPSINFACENGTKTSFPNNKFDVLISYGSYEHFCNPEKGIKELSRILTIGGYFFCMMPTLGIDRPDCRGEGWYEEKKIPGHPTTQLQWNLRRNTWEQYFSKYSLNLLPFDIPLIWGAHKPGVFFFGKKSAHL